MSNGEGRTGAHSCSWALAAWAAGRVSVSSVSAPCAVFTQRRLGAHTAQVAWASGDKGQKQTQGWG